MPIFATKKYVDKSEGHVRGNSPSLSVSLAYNRHEYLVDDNVEYIETVVRKRDVFPGPVEHRV